MTTNIQLLNPELPSFNRVKSMESLSRQKFEMEKQRTKQSLLANDFNWIISPQMDKNGLLYGGLALGNFKKVEKQEELNRLNFGAVVSVFKQKNMFIDPKIKHLRVFLSENSRQNFNSVFTSSSNFINSNLSKTNVLVYSQSRSSLTPLVVTAYLMREKEMSAKTAIEEIRSKRNNIFLNETLFRELTEYQKQLGQKLPGNTSQACEIM